MTSSLKTNQQNHDLYMYQPQNNRRPGITKNLELNNQMHYVQVEYENELPRVIMIWSKSKYGTTYPDLMHRIGMYMTKELQLFKDPVEALQSISEQVPRRTTGEPTTIDGLIADELLKDLYFGAD